MTQQDVLYRAVLADPDDDTPRLALADYLADTGDPADALRAEFIRLGVRVYLAPDEDQTARARLEHLWVTHRHLVVPGLRGLAAGLVAGPAGFYMSGRRLPEDRPSVLVSRGFPEAFVFDAARGVPDPVPAAVVEWPVRWAWPVAYGSGVSWPHHDRGWFTLWRHSAWAPPDVLPRLPVPEPYFTRLPRTPWPGAVPPAAEPAAAVPGVPAADVAYYADVWAALRAVAKAVLDPARLAAGLPELK